MQTPNLFNFATSELSQDAFICWLASWADPAHRKQNEALHTTAIAFLDRLLEVGKLSKVDAYSSVHASRQEHNVDVLLLVNGDIAIIIEDKINSKDHSDQLRRYKAAVAEHFPNRRIVGIYLKTGDQCDYQNAEQAGYRCFLRRDFLEVLERGMALGVTSDIFADFCHYVQRIEEAIQRFASVQVQHWDRPQWKGFFIALKEKLGDGDWGLRAGHSLTYRWRRRNEKYLRLHEDRLAFCLEVPDETQRQTKWAEWKQSLLAMNGTAGLSITFPRWKSGTRMTVALLDRDYREHDDRGLLDLPRTVEVIKKAEALMDAALNQADNKSPS